MKFKIRNFYIHWLMTLAIASAAVAVENPLSVPLDGAMVRYNGLYYGMGTTTNGYMLVSEDLLNWTNATPVLETDVPGPYELIHRNGTFYLYADQLGFGIADDPLKPFSALRKSGLSGEEMRMYQDKSGALFSVNRRLGSKKEGEIWLQRYSAPWKTWDKPTQLLDGRRGMWDSLDSSNLGEPEILNYRGNYYLLYAANHPGPRTGLREIGVAVNENPLRFENPDKMSEPVLVRNAERLLRRYRTILHSAEHGEWEGRYITEEPEEGWTLPDYKLSGWRSGEGAFGYPDEIAGTQLHVCRTQWDEDNIWVRRTFDLPGGDPKTLVLKIRNEGAVQVYINGKVVYESAQPNIAYSNFDITAAASGLLREEGNVIAVVSRVPSDARYRFLDFGLFDAEDEPVEPTVYGLNAPRVVTGPNGFEKWMYYHAWWNGIPGTGLDRVYFYDKELVVDGPTTATTPGYHPPPAQPTFSDTFPAEETTEWAERWDFSGGEWMMVDGQLQQRKAKGTAKAYLLREPARHYLFETGLRFPPKGKGAAGVIAWSDGVRDLIVRIDPYKRTWEYVIEPGSLLPKKYKLTPSFKLKEAPPGAANVSAPLHTLQVRKNSGHFTISLNGIDLTPDKPVVTDCFAAGVPGLYCKNSAAAFDAVRFTMGWDEYEEYITGWGTALDGTSFSGEWEQDRDLGLAQKSHSQVGRAFKGDVLEQYEFTVNVQTEELEEGKERLYGVFPVFADKDNYLKAMIDTRGRQLIVSGKLNGRDLKRVTKDLQHTFPRRHLYDKSTSYRDVTSWVYGLRSESVVSGMDILWLEGDYDHLQQEFYIPADEMVISYANLDRGELPNLWEDGRFNDADEPKPKQQRAGVFNPISIRPVEGNYVGFGFIMSGSVVVDSRTGAYIRPYVPGDDLGFNEEISDDTTESDTMSRPMVTLVTVDVESSYFFRCVKLADRVIIELNGRPMVEIEASWPPSQVGLVTEGQPAFFDGITLMHLPNE